MLIRSLLLLSGIGQTTHGQTGQTKTPAPTSLPLAVGSNGDDVTDALITDL